MKTLYSLTLSSAMALFTLSANSQAPDNDSCENAISIDDLFHNFDGQTYMSDVFTNVGATVGDDDPIFGLDCWLEVDGAFGDKWDPRDQTVWFTFIGDGTEYNILTSDCDGNLDNYIMGGDTQIAIYTGECGNLVEVVGCNEDSDNIDWDDEEWFDFYAELDFQTEDGVEYLLYVDGLNWDIFGDDGGGKVGGGEGVAEGEFCIEVTSVVTVVEEYVQLPVEVFPNPANTQFTIQTDLKWEQGQLIDALGKTVKEFRNSGINTFDVSDLPNGAYTLRLQNDQYQSAVEQVLINR